MRTALLALLALSLSPPAHARPRAKASLDTPSLEAFARTLLGGFDRLELAVPADDAHLVLFVADDDGRPLALRGPEGAADFRRRLAAWKADGWLLDTDVRDLACEAHAGAGVCVARYHQGFTLKGEPNGDAWIRGTIVAVEHDGGWQLVHLHESPDAAAAPEAAE